MLSLGFDGVIDVSVGVVGTIEVSLGVVGAIVVSAGWFVMVLVSAPVVTAVVSPRSGAAPISSSPRWQAASVAAAASIQIIFMWTLQSRRPDPARSGRCRLIVVSPRANDVKFAGQV